jgi:hypothetical protein
LIEGVEKGVYNRNSRKGERRGEEIEWKNFKKKKIFLTKTLRKKKKLETENGWQRS